MRAVSEPITKVTLNLYRRDVDYLRARYPIGYTEQIREIVRRHIRNLRYGPSDFSQQGEIDYE
jgi:hypothetical protein